MNKTEGSMQNDLSFGLLMFFICFIYLLFTFLYEVYHAKSNENQKDIEY